MQDHFQKQIKSLGRLLSVFALFIVFAMVGIFYLKSNPNSLNKKREYQEVPITKTEMVELDDEIISQSGFINDSGVSHVIQNCTQCHSAKLVTQNRMSKEGWQATITWMQETQNLWSLGDNREKIVTYLAKNYGPQPKGRRQNLSSVEWYELEQ